MAIFVISKNGERLMPTTCFGKVRHMLKDGRAVIANRKPFTIQLTVKTTGYIQPIELCVDSGYQHVGVSAKTENKELLAAQYDLLPDEKERHDAQRKYRRTRRNRKRHRAPRFDNRRASKPEDWFAPSIRHKMEAQVNLIQKYATAMPVTSIVVEVGQFDPAKLKAIEEGKAIPEGKDYQQGPRYNLETLREAVFMRDHHTCRVCSRSSFRDNALLHAHHALFWKGRHGNSVTELLTVCEKCHTPANHKEGGALYGLEPAVSRLEGATFMNIVRWKLVYGLEPLGIPITVTYGAETKAMRQMLGIEKSHVNDAYSMGVYHPETRATQELWQKRRRNNRCLEKFYDAKVVDIRDGKTKSGKNLGCERTNRRESRTSEKSLRKYRGLKKSKGRRAIRTNRYGIQPKDVLVYNGKRYFAKGVHCKGKNVILDNGKSVAVSKVECVYHCGGWVAQEIGKTSQ